MHNYKLETIKLEKNIRENLCDLELDKDLLTTIQKHNLYKKNKLNFINI